MRAAGSRRTTRAARTRLRRAGTVLTATGVVAVAYAALVVVWREPLTDLYARHRQHALAARLEQSTAEFRRAREAADTVRASTRPLARAPDEAVRAGAAAYARRLRLGQPIGRLRIPRLGLDVVVVHGTRRFPDLSGGPGHYPRTPLPGLGGTTAIAGHRTTFGAPFRHIDRLRRGDAVVLELPYGTLRYRVVSHTVVDADDWSVIRRRSYEALVLTACHPLWSASRRWVVVARLSSVSAA